VSRRVADPQGILAALAREHAAAPELSHMDGLLVRYDDWWFNMRPSNTEPLLRLNVEAKTEQRMAGERDRLLAKMV
jgi:phosphomannomutase